MVNTPGNWLQIWISPHIFKNLKSFPSMSIGNGKIGLMKRHSQKSCDTVLLKRLSLKNSTLIAYFIYKIMKILNWNSSVLARQPSWVANSLLRSSREGGGPPCVLASRSWGPICIVSYTHTLSSWVCLHHGALQLLVWWRCWWPLGLAKDSPMLP